MLQGSGFVTDFSIKMVTDFAGKNHFELGENTPVLYLWTQKGAMLHAKMLTTKIKANKRVC